jgi:hypothetical protein
MSDTTLKRAEPQPLPEEYLAPPEGVALPESVALDDSGLPPAPEGVESPLSEGVLPPPPIAPPDELVTPMPVRKAPMWPWIAGVIIAFVGVGVVALLFLRSGGGTESVSVDIAGIGTAEFTSVETTRTWEMQQGMTARPSSESRTFIVVRAELATDTADGVMDWAGEAEVGRTDLGSAAMDEVDDAFFIQVSSQDGEEGRDVTWVFNVPTDADLDALRMTLRDGEVVNLGDLPAYGG